MLFPLSFVTVTTFPAEPFRFRMPVERIQQLPPLLHLRVVPAATLVVPLFVMTRLELAPPVMVRPPAIVVVAPEANVMVFDPPKVTFALMFTVLLKDDEELHVRAPLMFIVVVQPAAPVKAAVDAPPAPIVIVPVLFAFAVTVPVVQSPAPGVRTALPLSAMLPQVMVVAPHVTEPPALMVIVPVPILMFPAAAVIA